MIEVRELRKSYGSKNALSGITFKAEQGEIFGLLGPNGAGKTTTIKILTGQLLPTSGESYIMGRNTLTEQDEIRPNMGIVPEGSNLYERLSVKENLEFFCRMYNCDMGNVDYFLEQVNLIKEKNTQIKKLSKGMRQRVLIIRALMHNPKVLFLDEPTSGLDPSSAGDIHTLLKKLNESGVTILLTSHNMEEVDRLCHRVAFLDRGRIAAVGTPDELKLKHSNRRMKVLLQFGSSIEERIIPLAGEESARLVSGWIADGRIKSIHSCEPTLADIFMEVTGGELV